jgi:hypothetical protein
VSFEVRGDARLRGSVLETRVTLRNVGSDAAQDVFARAELGGALVEERVGPIAAGESASVGLRLPAPERPGSHAIPLRIEFKTAAKAPALWQWAYLLVQVGLRVLPAVRVEVPEAPLETRGPLRVLLASADGFAHRVEVRARVSAGVGVLDERTELVVPAQGRVEARLRLIRGDAVRGGRLGVLVFTRALDSGAARDTVATGLILVAPDPALGPRLRLIVAAAGLLLILWALRAEWRARRPSTP